METLESRQLLSAAVSLATTFNRTGIVVDHSTFASNTGFDAGGNALSGTLLGTSKTWNGNTYTIGTTGHANVVTATGQTITLPAAVDGSVSVLAAAVNGSQPSQTFVVTYSDNTTQTFTQGISDWWKPQGYAGESKAITMSERDLAGGTQVAGTFYIYGYSFAVNSTKTVKSIRLPNNSHVQVLAIDVSPAADKQAPTTPTNLKATSVATTSAVIQWTASTDNVAVTKYSISRNGVVVGTVTGTTTSYTNTGLTAGTAYTYTVTASDAAGNKSPASASLKLTTTAADKTPPTTPTSLKTTAVAQTSVSLQWTASTDNVLVTGYSIARNGTVIATVSGTTTTYTNTGLTANTAYSYTVLAADAAGNKSPASTAMKVTTTAADKTPPTVPMNLQTTATTQTTISIQWSPSTDNVGVVSYLVYRSGKLVGTLAGSTTIFTDTALTVNTAYTYTVVASDAAGNKSVASAGLKVTTVANPAGAPNIPGAWDLSFSDDFNSVNPSIYSSQYWWNGNAGTFATFDPANVTTSNGILSLTANRQSETANNGVTNPYTSGLLTTGGDGVQSPGFDFTYGYVETRSQIAPGLGMWSALWMLPVSHQDSYEMDVFENLGRAPTTFQGFVHNWPNFGNGATIPLSFDMTQAYHTYGIDWEPNSVTWYIDGTAVHTYTNSAIVPNQPMYLILNLDVGGWAGGPNSTTPDSSSWLLDYLRVWQHPGAQNQTLSTTTLTSTATSVTAGQPVTLTATVATAGSVPINPTGTVTFMDGTTALGTVAVDGTGVATLTASSLSGGPHVITAIYNGDANLITSTSDPINATINPQTTATTVSGSSNPSTVGQAVAFTATVSAASGTPSGTVQFALDGVNFGDPITLVNGTASTAPITTLSAGTHTLSAVYSGDVNDVTSTAADVMLTVNPAAPPNDNFANALTLTGTAASATGTNVGATKEPNEPDHAGDPGGASVWWTWTAPTDGTVTLDTHGSDFNTLLAVYTGNSVSTLTLVPGGSNDDDPAGGTTTSKVSFAVTAGTVYWIAVDGVGGVTGNISLNLSLT